MDQHFTRNYRRFSLLGINIYWGNEGDEIEVEIDLGIWTWSLVF